MMDYYQDIQILDDPEMGYGALLSTVFNRIHLALVEFGDGRVGVSFPEWSEHPRSLGRTIRLHGSERTLTSLLDKHLIGGVLDYIRVSALRRIPSAVEHRRVRRVQSKSGIPRLARRYAKRHGVTEAEARMHYQNLRGKTLKLPFVELRSASTGRHFRLFIEHGSLHDDPVEGTFSAYGLSSEATIPWF